jgi:hypothetical protein
MTRLRDRLPRQQATGIGHGDYRIDNTLLHIADASDRPRRGDSACLRR